MDSEERQRIVRDASFWAHEKVVSFSGDADENGHNAEAERIYAWVGRVAFEDAHGLGEKGDGPTFPDYERPLRTTQPDEDMDRTMGARLDEAIGAACANARISRAELSDVLGIGRNTLASWTKKPANARRHCLETLCEMSGYSLEFLRAHDQLPKRPLSASALTILYELLSDGRKQVVCDLVMELAKLQAQIVMRGFTQPGYAPDVPR